MQTRSQDPAPTVSTQGILDDPGTDAGAEVEEFVRARCAEWRSDGVTPAYVEPVLLDAVRGGKMLRSHLVRLGWWCGAPPGRAVARVGAALELLHVFALTQDDVMDASLLRRGRPAVHVRLARAYAESGGSGDPERFGASAAVLLADLCLVWAERMWRESGVPQERLLAAWPRFDAMRTELALGQLADLANDAATTPSLERVLAIARRKSGDYTVRWPLELGASLAGCPAPVLAALRGYGGLVGEAFQMRDDLLGVLGVAERTGKPVSDDLRAGKATSLVVLARARSTGAARRELDELARATGPENVGDAVRDDARMDRWRELIVASGAPRALESMIRDRVARARAYLVTGGVAPHVVAALDELTDRHVALTEAATA